MVDWCLIGKIRTVACILVTDIFSSCGRLEMFRTTKSVF